MNTKCKIFFRVDAGPEIEFGHLIYTLVLAEMKYKLLRR